MSDEPSSEAGWVMWTDAAGAQVQAVECQSTLAPWLVQLLEEIRADYGLMAAVDGECRVWVKRKDSE
jgi:hypothetical protein